MKISGRLFKRFCGLLSLSILLIPHVVFAQDADFYVIPSVQKLKNVVTVAKSGGMFTNPVAAVKSIVDASAGNPYLVVIGPGVYTLTETLQMKGHVNIVGSGQNVTRLTGAISTDYDDSRSAIISGASNASLGFLTVENVGGEHYSTAVINSGASPEISDLTASASGGFVNIGIHNTSSSPRMRNVTATGSGVKNNNYGVFCHQAAPVMENVTARAEGAASGNMGIHIYGLADLSSPKMMNVKATAYGATGYNWGVYIYDSDPTMTELSAEADGGSENYGVNIYGYYLPAFNVFLRRSATWGGTKGLNVSSPGTILASQTTIINGVSGSGTKKCVACDNGVGAALGANCQ